MGLQEYQVKEDSFIETKRNKQKFGLSFYISIFSIALSIALSFISFSFFNKNKELAESINNLNTQLTGISKNNTDKDFINTTKSSIEYLEKQVRLLTMEHDWAGGIATDDLTVEKATLYIMPKLKDGDVETLNGTIDIYTQPGISAKYRGQGKFDINDRELRVMILDLMKDLEKSYGIRAGLLKDRFPKWETADISVTIKNYEIGDFKNGSFKLKGE